jgi:hypothetical protein
MRIDFRNKGILLTSILARKIQIQIKIIFINKRLIFENIRRIKVQSKIKVKTKTKIKIKKKVQFQMTFYDLRLKNDYLCKKEAL